MEIRGYSFSVFRTILTCTFVVLSCGILLCLLYWKSGIKLRLTHTRCALKNSEKIWLKAKHKQEFVEVVHRTYQKDKTATDVFFYNKNLKYIWQEEIDHFVQLTGLKTESCADYFCLNEGLSSREHQSSMELYGDNRMHIEVASVWRLIIDEALNPFYIFQVYVVIVWGLQSFFQYCIVIVVFSLIAIMYTVYEMRKSSIALRDAIHSESQVCVIRDGQEVEVSSLDVVPGDVLVIPPGVSSMECDAVLISGNCVVNESMLTGESVPVMKVTLMNDDSVKYSFAAHKKSTLFCGTKILQTGGQRTLAVVSKTGFSTSKGELVLTIMFPKPVDFHFYSSFMRFMIVLLIIGIIAMTYSAVVWVNHGATGGTTALKVLDILTFVVPPLLSAGVTFATGFAQRRLKKQGIYCISTRYICLTGGLDLFCFDKTGTLTEDSLNLLNVVPVKNAKFQAEVKRVREQTVGSAVVSAMACCHSLTLVDGKIAGDSLDLETFNATKWQFSYHEPDQDDECIFRVNSKHDKKNVIRVISMFPFDSHLQRMGVVAKNSDQRYDFYAKGSPEVIVKLCDSDTVPENFAFELQSYTLQGYRVLAMASKSLDIEFDRSRISRMKREEFEDRLTFLGLLIFENPLKGDTRDNMIRLQNAGLRTVMATGDNILTAVHVARKCNMINDENIVLRVDAENVSTNDHSRKIEIDYVRLKSADKRESTNIDEEVKVPLMDETITLAIEGKVFQLIREESPELLDKILMRCVVFARMLPDHKVQLIESLQRLGYHTGMCGDGANDCGALKAAHSGISLSTEEASVASPFTSKMNSISCVPNLIREGRASLVSVFTIFNYQVGAFCFIALFAVLMLFYDASLFTDTQWVACDILFIAPPLLFGATKPSADLAKRRPLRNLISFIPVFTMLSFSFIMLFVYIFIWFYTESQPWFVKAEFDPKTKHRPSDVRSTMLFYAMSFGYIFCIYIFSSGKPHRQPFYSNVYLTITLILEIAYVFFLVLAPQPVKNYINLVDPPDTCFIIIVLVAIFGGFIVACVWQFLVIEKIVDAKLMPYLYKVRGPRTRYEKLEDAMRRRALWPPIDGTEFIDDDKNHEEVELTKILCKNSR
ncbi:ATP13A3 (predicted) [Pycnogonum litorale]